MLIYIINIFLFIIIPAIVLVSIVLPQVLLAATCVANTQYLKIGPVARFGGQIRPSTITTRLQFDGTLLVEACKELDKPLVILALLIYISAHIL